MEIVILNIFLLLDALQFDEDQYALKKDLLCKSFTTFVFDTYRTLNM